MVCLGSLHSTLNFAMCRLHNFLIIACLTAFTPPLQAAGPAPLSGHPLLGTLIWTLFGGCCTENFRYQPNRVLRGTSGLELVEKNCEASTMPDAKGFYQVIETVPRHNNKTACLGALIKGPSDQSIRFFQFRSAPDKMLMCQIASVGACFGPLTRTD